jgi:hypothetical protein
MEAHGGRGGMLLLILNLGTKWGWVVSITPRPRFTSGTHWIGGCVGPRAGLDAGARRKILCPCRGSNLDRSIVQPVVRHYTAWATAAHLRQQALTLKWRHSNLNMAGQLASISFLNTIGFTVAYPVKTADIRPSLHRRYVRISRL